ncbi:MAG: cytochrome c5 family protein [Legionellales bacterium]|nr:cytochrome c5 family protein [Legionellales bacterium]
MKRLYRMSLWGLIIIPLISGAAHRPLDQLSQVQDSEQPGELIYQQYCALCHDPNPQIPLGAPRLGMAEDWQTRDLSDREALFERMDNGMGAMPPRGGCFECSDELLQAAIDYLIEHNDSP